MNPADRLQLLEWYAFVILPALVVAEQIGIPRPAVPALLAVGALAAQGRGSMTRGMLIAKFVPGLTTVMPPLAGVFAVGRARFGLCDLGGVLLWAGTWMGLGYVFSDAIAVVTERAAGLGRALGLVAVSALAAHILVKYLRRRLFLRGLRMARISPEVLKRRLDAGEDIAIIEFRTPLDVAATPYAIPGSRWLTTDAIDEHEAELLRAREPVLYCS